MSMFGIMDLMRMQPNAVVGINQLGTYGEIRFDCNTTDSVFAVHKFLDNRWIGGYATVYLPCGCEYMFSARDVVTHESLCEEHYEILED